MMSPEETFNPDNYPSINLAYEIVLPSYDWALRRLQSVEKRIEGLLRLIVTITLAFPVVAAVTSQDASFADFATWQGAVTLALFLTTLVIGLAARRYKGIRLIDPDDLYNQHLHKRCLEFKKDFIKYAGEDFQDNAQVIDDKSTYADMIAVTFMIELVFGILWLLSI